MSFRIFDCKSCGHRMRLLGESCGECHGPKPVFQRPSTYLFAVVFLVLAIAILSQ